MSGLRLRPYFRPSRKNRQDRGKVWLPEGPARGTFLSEIGGNWREPHRVGMRAYLHRIKTLEFQEVTGRLLGMSSGGAPDEPTGSRPHTKISQHRAIKFVTKSAANMTLLCFPHGGAGASTYFPWREKLLGHGIDLVCVQYPGREERIAEPPSDSIEEIASEIADAWTSLGRGRICAFFGHSMGAVVALEVLVRLPEFSKRAVSRLLVSGKNAPHVPPLLSCIGGLRDEAFLQEVQNRYGNIHEELLADPQMRELITTTLRADLRAVEGYSPSGSSRLPNPITVFYGEQDPCTDETGLSAWSRYSSGETRVRKFLGGHFFHQVRQNDVVSEIVGELKRDSADQTPRL